MTPERILDKPDLDAALDALCARDARMAALRAASPEPPLRRISADIAGLVWIVNSQLISVAAARAIHGRVEAALGAVEHAALSAAPDELFRAAGMSRVKLKTVRALCAAVDDGLDVEGLEALDEPEARARLLAIPGVGPWTADVFLLFAHGRPDAFPAGDVAVQSAMKDVLGLAARPDRGAAEELAEPWRPLRGVAAQLLWAYYLGRRRGRDAAPSRTPAGPVRPASVEEIA
ncbi:DNA-3-methyladenine glycosylase family protein [Hansschlegelia sp. KR7-227]|uniref:DNA-3-methyladenine glycosylase family protein n=1 Tax=Hansschlegelia sp. KR7-227 TaxID=3400914 RepID=UPI003C10E445